MLGLVCRTLWPGVELGAGSSPPPPLPLRSSCFVGYLFVRGVVFARSCLVPFRWCSFVCMWGASLLLRARIVFFREALPSFYFLDWCCVPCLSLTVFCV